MIDEKKYLIYLHSLGFSQKQLSRLFTEKQNYREVYEALSDSFLEKQNFLPKQRESILEKYKKIDTNYIDKKIEKEEIQIYTCFDDTYPNLLKEIVNPPYFFYIKGELPVSHMLSIVGSRKISSYGKKCIRSLIPELVPDFCIVSGGAMGCDAEAHEITLSSKGKTIIVVGTGIDVVYPKINTQLFEKALSEGSCILSIFPLGEPGNSYNFPQRNEIISGLSLGTLVVEAGEKSGTLITAQLALDQGRELFAIPGPIDSSGSIGCNRLIKKGEAKMVTEASDILEEFSFYCKKKNSKNIDHLSELQKSLYEKLQEEPLSSEEIFESFSLSPALLSAEISMMELQKVLQKNKEGKYEIF